MKASQVNPYASQMNELEALAKACADAAQFYREKPGLAGPGAISDLYEAIARLARAVNK